MWVNKAHFQLLNEQNTRLTREWNVAHAANEHLTGAHIQLRSQKAKDDLSIDWLRHRVNALEKQNAVLMMKATGIAMPVPEIVPTRPGTIAGMPLDFDTMPSFDDVGDSEAKRLGIIHAPDGSIEYSH